MNWEPLALTEAENFCTASVGIVNSFKAGDPDVALCMQETMLDNITPSIADSTRWACEGVKSAGWTGTMTKCTEIIEGGQLWMLLGGGFAHEKSWNDAHPRPVNTQEGVLPGDTRSNRAGDNESPSDTTGEEESE